MDSADLRNFSGEPINHRARLVGASIIDGHDLERDSCPPNDRQKLANGFFDIGLLVQRGNYDDEVD